MTRSTSLFRFYEELNDFVPEDRRKREFAVEIDRARSVKDAIEACGIPHPHVRGARHHRSCGFVRATRPEAQLREVIHALQLERLCRRID